MRVVPQNGFGSVADLPRNVNQVPAFLKQRAGVRMAAIVWPVSFDLGFPHRLAEAGGKFAVTERRAIAKNEMIVGAIVARAFPLQLTKAKNVLQAGGNIDHPLRASLRRRGFVLIVRAALNQQLVAHDVAPAKRTTFAPAGARLDQGEKEIMKFTVAFGGPVEQIVNLLFGEAAFFRDRLVGGHARRAGMAGSVR